MPNHLSKFRHYLILLFVFISLIVIYKHINNNDYQRRLETPLISYTGVASRDLRYVAFGTSVTWGATINRDKEAYIKILSKDGVNLGIRASDPSYPGMCTQSMVGDSVYDVIIIEYDRRYKGGLSNLVKRLRERFPHAIIITTIMWHFATLWIDDYDGKTKSFVKWIAERGFKKNTPDLLEFIRQSSDDDLNMFYMNYQLDERMEYLKKVKEDYNTIIYSWEMKRKCTSNGEYCNDMKQLILKHLPLNAEDWIHLSSEGHKFAADGIAEIVENNRTTILKDTVGEWGDGDFCAQWIIQGKMSNKIRDSFRYDGSRVLMEEFHSVKGYYALHFPFGKTRLRIYNRFSGLRQLAFTYMATGPVERRYPMVNVSLQFSPNSVTIDPFDTFYDYPVHIQLTTVVAELQPGPNIVIMDVLENTAAPFRLIGYTITNGEDKLSRLFEKNDNDMYKVIRR